MNRNHTDILERLNSDKSLKKKLQAIHNALKIMLPFIQRIGIAMYDDKANLLKTFLSNSDEKSPLIHYEAKLDEAPSLKQIIEKSKPRVLNDLSVLDNGIHEHTMKIKEQGYQASYTFPMYQDGTFTGFIFFNSYDKDCFSENTLNLLDVFSHLISSLIMYEVSNIKSVLAALRTANEMVHYKDPETGSHLQRMARFSRIIAKELSVSGKYTFDDKYIEDIFYYAPLHDVGKIGIPDRILLKPGKLDDKEFETMKTHASMGRQVIDSIIRNFEFDSFGNTDILRNIAEYHHETLDGRGYPDGLSKKDIPVEARIIAVADIFDALTSKRPYKEAWSNADAFEMLRKMANSKLDKDCVEALYKNQPEVEEIQARFREETI